MDLHFVHPASDSQSHLELIQICTSHNEFESHAMLDCQWLGRISYNCKGIQGSHHDLNTENSIATDSASCNHTVNQIQSNAITATIDLLTYQCVCFVNPWCRTKKPHFKHLCIRMSWPLSNCTATCLNDSANDGEFSPNSISLIMFLVNFCEGQTNDDET